MSWNAVAKAVHPLTGSSQGGDLRAGVLLVYTSSIKFLMRPMDRTRTGGSRRLIEHSPPVRTSMSNAASQPLLLEFSENKFRRKTKRERERLETTQKPRGEPHTHTTMPHRTAAGRPLMGSSEDSPRFVRLRLLGEGASGAAWLCRDTDNGDRLVAVKILFVRPSSPPPGSESAASDSNNSSFRANPRGVNRVEAQEQQQAPPPLQKPDSIAPTTQSEIAILRDISHPNVIRLYEALVDPRSGNLLIVMEFADAGDLRTIIRAREQRGQLLQEHEAVFIFLQLGMAMQHLHSRGIMHRDVKTANILMMANGVLKLADFGFSKKYDRETLTQSLAAKTFCGTPCYVAPELWTGTTYGRKAEVWSAGVVLYELLALQRPFGGGTIQELSHAIVSGKFAPLPPSISDGIRSVVASLLQVNPAKRPTMRQVLQMPQLRQYYPALQKAFEKNELIDPSTKSLFMFYMNELIASLETADNDPQQQEDVSAPGVGLTTSPSAKTSSQPPPPMGLAAAVVVGYVRRYVVGPPPSWTPHCLALLWNGDLVLEDPTVIASNFAVAPPTPQRRVVDARRLCAAMVIPSEVSYGAPHVFAVGTTDQRCTWFQAQTQEECVRWVQAVERVVRANAVASKV